MATGQWGDSCGGEITNPWWGIVVRTIASVLEDNCHCIPFGPPPLIGCTLICSDNPMENSGKDLTN